MNHTIRSVGVLASSALIGGLLAVTAPSASADDVNIAPGRRVTGDMSSAVGVTRDAAGRVYVADHDGSRVTVHAKNANGPSSALRVLAGPATGIMTPRGVAIDKNGFLYVALSGGEIKVFAPGATGDTAPIKTIGTGAGAAFALTFDAAGRLYVRKPTAVNVYAPSASGSPAPTVRQITGLASSDGGIAVDSAGTTWVGTPGALVAFSSNANGAATPLRTITGGNTTLGTFNYGVDTDAAKRVYATNFNANSVAVFAPNANGNVAPLKLLGGVATQLITPTGLSIAANGSLTVGNYTDDSYVEFGALLPQPKPKPAVKKPGKVRALKVKGAKRAKTRRVTWKAPKSNGGAKLTRYRITVKKGSKTLLRKTVKASKRSYKLKRGKLRNGKNRVFVQAKNKKGYGKNAVKSFRVRK